MTLADAASNWQAIQDATRLRCRSQLQEFLMLASRPGHERGGDGERAFLAFKLHRFISGAGQVYATLRASGQRRVTLDGQTIRSTRQGGKTLSSLLLPKLRQEHHPVVLTTESGTHRVLPRDIDETPTG